MKYIVTCTLLLALVLASAQATRRHPDGFYDMDAAEMDERSNGRAELESNLASWVNALGDLADDEAEAEYANLEADSEATAEGFGDADAAFQRHSSSVTNERAAKGGHVHPADIKRGGYRTYGETKKSGWAARMNA